MRFGNWDVILFPIDSRTPIQEFKVEAFSVSDPETTDTLPSIFDPKIPLLSCFMPSQDEASAFKVSVHTWSPIRYVLDPAVLSTNGKIPCYMARVLIDGQFASLQAIKPDTVFPITIDTRPCSNPRVTRDYLRWPQFHPEQLNSPDWDAKDEQGRIKLIVSEALFDQENGSVTRGRNLVAFAFQHIPLPILRSAGIAWPNESLCFKSSALAIDLGQAGNRPSMMNVDAVLNNGSMVDNANEPFPSGNDVPPNPTATRVVPDQELDRIMSQLPEFSSPTPAAPRREVLQTQSLNVVSPVKHTINTKALPRNENIPTTPKPPLNHTALGTIPSLHYTPDQNPGLQKGSPLKTQTQMKDEPGTGKRSGIAGKGKAKPTSSRAPVKRGSKAATGEETSPSSKSAFKVVKTTRAKRVAGRRAITASEAVKQEPLIPEALVAQLIAADPSTPPKAPQESIGSTATAVLLINAEDRKENPIIVQEVKET